jgi:DNA-binding NarL/FixJ family response regulator
MKNLTAREREVARLVAGGHRTKVVAHTLGITYGTAKLHLAHVYAKLGISKRIELVHAWVRHECAPKKETVPVHEINWEPAE